MSRKEKDEGKEIRRMEVADSFHSRPSPPPPPHKWYVMCLQMLQKQNTEANKGMFLLKYPKDITQIGSSLPALIHFLSHLLQEN